MMTLPLTHGILFFFLKLEFIGMMTYTFLAENSFLQQITSRWVQSTLNYVQNIHPQRIHVFPYVVKDAKVAILKLIP